jgi:peptidoglycan/LPS O-acetylase OafA/YrhL
MHWTIPMTSAVELLQILKRPRRIDDRGFSSALLSLRGLAALFVTVFHSMLVFRVAGLDHNYRTFLISADSPWDFIANSLIIYLTNGHAAVTFFFVHSGFVLSLSIGHSDFGSRALSNLAAAAAYLVRRVFRLWPMIIFACICGFVIQTYFNVRHDDAYYTAWFTKFFSIPTDFRDLLENIALTRYNLVPFLWSLNVEVGGSLMIPLIYFACRRYVTAFLLIAVLYFSFPMLASFLPRGYASFNSFYTTACFIIGCLIGFVGADLPPKPAWLNRDAISFGALFILISARWFMPDIPSSFYVESMASAVIIYNVYYYPSDIIPRFCNRPFVKFMGEISYSLYVNSWICIFFIGTLLASIVPTDFIVQNGLLMNLSVVAATLVITVVISWMTFSLLEEPLMKLGRRLGKKLAIAIGYWRPVDKAPSHS